MIFRSIQGRWRAAVASGEPHESEVRFRRADGEYRWHLDRGLPLRDDEGDIIKWYGVVTDIEDRKRVEEAFRRSEPIWPKLKDSATRAASGGNRTTERLSGQTKPIASSSTDSTLTPTVDSVVQRMHPLTGPSRNRSSTARPTLTLTSNRSLACYWLTGESSTSTR